jgi:prepilin-type N-terminal cleavage/methylation domain-containing protein
MKRPDKKFQRGMTLLELSVVLLILIALAGLAVPYVYGTGRTAMCQATDATMQSVKEAIMGGAAGVGYYADMLGRYPQDLAGLSPNSPPNYSLHYLFSDKNAAGTRVHQTFNANTGVGWRGPYLMSGATLSGSTGKNFSHANYTFLTDGDTVVNDGWGRPLVLQVPNQATCDNLTGKTGTENGECARLVSAGPGSGVDMSEGDIDTRINNDLSTEAHRANDDRILYLRIPTPPNDNVNISCNNG